MSAPVRFAPTLVFVLLQLGIAPAAEPAPVPVRLADPELKEASGLAVSPTDPEFLWLINDSGAKARLHLADRTGAARGVVDLEGTRNVDWEDLAAFRWQDRGWLLVGDIGDNEGERPSVVLHLVPEPALPASGESLKQRVKPEWTREFRYEGGPRDCEGLAVDLATESILLLSKRESPPGLFRLPLRPPEDGGVETANRIGNALPVTPPPNAGFHPFGLQPTAFDISPDGRAAAILTYQGAYLVRRSSGQSWPEAFARKPTLIAAHSLRQAESIAFEPDGRSVLLTSEGDHPPLLKLPLEEPAAEQSDASRREFECPLMGTRFSIVCYEPDGKKAETAAMAAFAEAEAINEVASDYIVDGELLSLSKAPVGEPVKVSKRLFPILVAAREIAGKTQGAYDPTLGPLTKLWRESRRTGALPDTGTLAAAKAACGWQKFTLDPEARTVTLTVPGMRFDLGGIAKGYAADRMLEIMQQSGIPRACITAGGDVRAGAPPVDRFGWTIGVKAFDSHPAENVFLLAGAVSTSGDLHQFVEIDGTRYSHIVDPATGLGLTNRIAVSVQARTATLSDALATAACVVGAEKAEAMAKAAGANEVRVSTP